MHLRRFVCIAVLAATALLAVGAASASSGTASSPPASAASPNKLGVRYTVNKFVRRGNHLYAYGTAIARFIPTSGAVTTSRHRFTASVAIRGRRFAAAQTICPVLELTIQQVDVNLLGALIHLDKVHLVITADSEGGLLGDLLCKLTKQGKLSGQASKLTWAAKKSGLATTGTGVVVTLQLDSGSSDSSTTATAPTGRRLASALVICPVLDLTLGPVDLNLLGLLVHLDTVHLTINADSEGGVLGSLLCSLAGGP